MTAPPPDLAAGSLAMRLIVRVLSTELHRNCVLPYVDSREPATPRCSASRRAAGLREAQTARRRGLAHFLRGELGPARSLLEEALQVRRELLGESHPATALTANSLASVYMELGDLDGARFLWASALVHLSRSPRAGAATTALIAFNLGSCLLTIGRPEEARAPLELALSRYAAIGGMDVETLMVSRRLGEALSELGDVDGAQKHLERAWEIHRRLGRPASPGEIASLHLVLASVLEKRGDARRARQCLDEALAASREWPEAPLSTRPSAVSDRLFLAALEEARGNVDRAIDLAQSAFAAQRRVIASVLPVVSSRQRSAFMVYHSALLNWMISLHVDSAPGDPRALRAAFAAILEKKARLQDAETRLRLRVGETEPEKVVARELRELEGAKAMSYWSAKVPASPEEHKDRLQVLELCIARAESKLADLRAARPNGDAPWETPSLAAVQAALPRDAALVEFVAFRRCRPAVGELRIELGEQRYAAYVVHCSGTIRWAELGPAARIDEAVRAFRDSVARKRPEVLDTARRVYEQTFAAIRPLLDDQVRRLIIAPDGALNLVAFAALVDPEGRYLVESFEISYVSSGRDVVGFGGYRGKPAHSEAALVVGGIDYDEAIAVPGEPAREATERAFDKDRFTLPPLPATATEASAIGEILGARILMGDEATEAAVKGAKSPRILHLATHGFFLGNPAEPEPLQSVLSFRTADPALRSVLALAGFNRRAEAADANDGVLTALEVAGLDLRGTEVVVLSACDTAVGDVQNGEGVFGLRRALAVAGSRTQIVSLWKVADCETTVGMIAWYELILQGVPRAEAMRRIQLAALRGEPLTITDQGRARAGEPVEPSETASDPRIAGTRHPYYWASFILSGEPGPLPAQPPGTG